MKRLLTLLVAAAVLAGLLALERGGVAEAKEQIRTHECVYCAHGSAAERTRYGKPPGTPGKGPGGGGGGGKAPCAKTFAQWKGVTQLDVFIDTAGGPAAIAAADFEAYVKRAFEEWACASGLGESIAISYLVSADGAEITVGWGDLGSSGILGQAFTPTQGKRILVSQITMNSNQSGFTWTLGPGPAACGVEVANGAGTSYDLLSVLIHEVGHALGIDHPNRFCDPDDPCYPETMYSCTGAEEFMRRAPNAGDLAAVQSLYGADAP